ncbi:MAG: hypothetical protein IKQ30_07320 [Bacteroidales bacterium]|nr:hypothetical protein [Bacteroidales bacterium]
MLRSIVILSIILCLSMVAQAQDDGEEDFDDPVVDSLLREYAVATSDTTRVRLCWEIGDESNNPDTVLKYAQIGVALLDGRDSSLLASLYGFQGWAYNCIEKYSTAIEYYKKAVVMFRSIDNMQNAIMHSVNMSRAYQNLNMYSEMWRTLYDALGDAQQNEDTSNICYCYYTIAGYYGDFGMKQQSIEMADKLYQFAKRAHRYDDMSLGASKMSSQLFDSTDVNACREAIKWGRIALDCYEKSGDHSYFYAAEISSVLGTLVLDCLAIATIEGNDAYIDSASHYIDVYEAYVINMDMAEEVNYIIATCVNEAMIKYARHDYKGAEKKLYEALKYAWGNEVHSYDKEFYENLAETNYKLADYRNALKYYEMYRKEVAPLRGSRVIVEAAAFEVRSVVEQEQAAAEYEKIKAEKELEDRRRHFSRMLIVSAVGFVALLTFIFILWRMLQNTRKGNAVLVSHNEEIKAQNEELNVEKANFAAINDKMPSSSKTVVR